MGFDFNELEKKLEIACKHLQKDFIVKYSSDKYISVRGAKLEVFINALQKEFKNIAEGFIKENNITKDTEARRKILSITKQYAKKCIEEFSKV